MGVKLRFGDNAMQLDIEVIKVKWKPTWKKGKIFLKKSFELKRMELYQSNNSRTNYLEKKNRNHFWLIQHLHQSKTASIMGIVVQVIEARSWKVTRGLIDEKSCRACSEK